MTYDIRRRIAKMWATEIVEEEAEVWTALEKAGYRFISFSSPGAEDAPRPQDFTQGQDLYDTYLMYRRRHGNSNFPDLTFQQFGVAFNAVTEETLLKARKWININGIRKKAWGYSGVRGPKSQVTRLKSGRPCYDNPAEATNPV